MVENKREKEKILVFGRFSFFFLKVVQNRYCPKQKNNALIYFLPEDNLLGSSKLKSNVDDKSVKVQSWSSPKISMGECTTILSAYTVYRHLGQCCTNPSVWSLEKQSNGKRNYLLSDSEKCQNHLTSKYLGQ